MPTYLRCGRCEKPICARCRVATPVGYRCFECANITSLPTYAVSGSYYARAIATGFATATVVGLVWGVLPAFDFWAALILGVATGELVSRAANMKRGPGLQIVAVAAAAWGILLSRIVLAYVISVPNLLNVVARLPGNTYSPLLRGVHPGVFDVVAVFSHTDLVGWLFLALALFLAYIRLR